MAIEMIDPHIEEKKNLLLAVEKATDQATKDQLNARIAELDKFSRNLIETKLAELKDRNENVAGSVEVMKRENTIVDSIESQKERLRGYKRLYRDALDQYKKAMKNVKSIVEVKKALRHHIYKKYQK